jgi:SAM-dependent methyltransferase
VHLPETEWNARAAELPPRDSEVAVDAATPGEAVRLAAELVARGFAHARAVSTEDRSETGPARAVAWRPASALLRCADRLPTSGRALDVACGAGRDVAWLAARGLDTIGLDILPDALARATHLARAAAELAEGAPLLPRARTGFVCADAGQAPVRDEAFDLVTGCRFLERELFAQALRWLRPGGLILWQTFSTRANPDCHPRRAAYRLAPGELAKLCNGAGFGVLEAWEDGVFDGVLARREA